jgi:hypothetical protein
MSRAASRTARIDRETVRNLSRDFRADRCRGPACLERLNLGKSPFPAHSHASRDLARLGNRWLKGEDSNLDMTNSKSDAVACPRGAAEPHFTTIYKPLETFEFREPYRIRRVQSSGDKWAIRRRMSRLCRFESGVQLCNRCCHWAEWPTSSGREYTASAKLAEGEELGSNLLHVGRRGGK